MDLRPGLAVHVEIHVHVEFKCALFHGQRRFQMVAVYLHGFGTDDFTEFIPDVDLRFKALIIVGCSRFRIVLQNRRDRVGVVRAEDGLCRRRLRGHFQIRVLEALDADFVAGRPGQVELPFAAYNVRDLQQLIRVAVHALLALGVGTVRLRHLITGDRSVQDDIDRVDADARDVENGVQAPAGRDRDTSAVIVIRRRRILVQHLQ